MQNVMQNNNENEKQLDYKQKNAKNNNSINNKKSEIDFIRNKLSKDKFDKMVEEEELDLLDAIKFFFKGLFVNTEEEEKQCKREKLIKKIEAGQVERPIVLDYEINEIIRNNQINQEKQTKFINKVKSEKEKEQEKINKLTELVNNFKIYKNNYENLKKNKIKISKKDENDLIICKENLDKIFKQAEDLFNKFKDQDNVTSENIDNKNEKIDLDDFIKIFNDYLNSDIYGIKTTLGKIKSKYKTEYKETEETHLISLDEIEKSQQIKSPFL